MSELMIDEAKALRASFGTPLYIIDTQALQKRYHQFIDAFHSQYPKVVLGLSYKTNPLMHVAKTLHQLGAIPEVVSSDEYQLARRFCPDKSIIFNGPIKTDSSLVQALDENVIIHCDHFAEIKRIEQIANQRNSPVDIGLRLAFDDKDSWDRFGFNVSSKEAKAAVDYIKQSKYLMLTSLHTHIGTNISDLNRFKMMACQMSDFALKLFEQGVKLKSIDIGGGLHGAIPRWHESTPCKRADVKAYAQTVVPHLQEALKKHNATLFIEPGRALLEEIASLLFSVHAVRHETKNEAVYITDMSINAVPTFRFYKHPVTSFKKGDLKSTTLLGSSCMQHDKNQTAYELTRLEQGDLLMMHHVGAYNLSRSTPFIHFRPAVVAWDSVKKEVSLIREKESLESYLAFERDHA